MAALSPFVASRGGALDFSEAFYQETPDFLSPLFVCCISRRRGAILPTARPSGTLAGFHIRGMQEGESYDYKKTHRHPDQRR